MAGSFQIRRTQIISGHRVQYIKLAQQKHPKKHLLYEEEENCHYSNSTRNITIRQTNFSKIQGLSTIFLRHTSSKHIADW